VSESNNVSIPPEEDPSFDGNLTASIRPVPPDYDPRAPKKYASIRELRLKREANAADKTEIDLEAKL
jgi:hypothetical protein